MDRDIFQQKCKCGAIAYFPLQGGPEFLSPTVPPEEGHKHEYKPFDPLVEMLNQNIQCLERIERHLGIA